MISSAVTCISRRDAERAEKGVKTTLAAMLPVEVSYRVLHHASKSNMDLQIADYCAWAIYRKWAGPEARSLMISFALMIK